VYILLTGAPEGSSRVALSVIVLDNGRMEITGRLR
jgi:hypothetical protein